MAGKKGKLPAAELIAGECLAVRVQTLNRAVTVLYDEALRRVRPRIDVAELVW